MSGQDAEALEALIGMGFPPETVGAIRRAYGEGGMKGAWAVYLEQLQARSGLECTSIPGTGIHYLLRLERYESALRCIEESAGKRTLAVQFYLKVNPRFDPIRGDPRFQAALEKMGLAD
jgi:hypothetical protein